MPDQDGASSVSDTAEHTQEGEAPAVQGLFPRLRGLFQYDDIQSVVSLAGQSFVLQGVGIVLGFVFHLLVARILGPSGVGVFYLALTLAMVATIPGRLGLDTALVKYTAKFRETEEWGRLLGTSRRARAFALVASGLAASVLVLGAPLLANDVFKEPRLVLPIRILGVAVVPLSLMRLQAGVLRGLEKIKASLTVEHGKYGFYLAAIPVVAVGAIVLGPDGAAAGYLAAAVVIVGAGLLLIHHYKPESALPSEPLGSRELLSTSVPLMVIASMMFILNWTDTLMVGFFLTSSAVGIYQVAWRVATVLTMVLFAFNMINAPRFSALYERGDKEGLQELVGETATLIAILTSIMFAGLIFYRGFVLGLFGEGFQGGASVLIVLAVAQLLNASVGSVAYLLMMTGLETVYQKIAASAAALNIILNLLLVPRLGIEGAAIASGVSLVVMNLLAVGVAWRARGIISLPFVHRLGTQG